MLRRPPRAIALWIAAGAVAVATAVMVATDLAALDRQARELGPRRGAVVARVDLPLGATITAGDVRVRDIHASQLPPGTTASVAAVVGRVVRSPVLRGGYVVERNLAARGRTGLDGVIPEGLRAVRVVVEDTIRPRAGAVVDVMVTYESSTTAVLVAPGVVAVGTDDPGGSRTGTGVGVTVLVSAKQARDLAAATAHGTLSLALAPPEEALGP